MPAILRTIRFNKVFPQYIFSFQALYFRFNRTAFLLCSIQQALLGVRTSRTRCSIWSDLQTVTLRLENGVFQICSVLLMSLIHFQILTALACKKVARKCGDIKRIAAPLSSQFLSYVTDLFTQNSGRYNRTTRAVRKQKLGLEAFKPLTSSRNYMYHIRVVER